jgi:hypothetical protein
MQDATQSVDVPELANALDDPNQQAPAQSLPIVGCIEEFGY